MSHRGAKTAMTLALREPDLVSNIVSVDNAPIDASLGSDFAKYIRGMRMIDESGVVRQAEADKILQDYESVDFPHMHVSSPQLIQSRNFLFASFFLGISIARIRAKRSSFASL